jgi:hypothetical protein
MCAKLRMVGLPGVGHERNVDNMNTCRFFGHYHSREHSKDYQRAAAYSFSGSSATSKYVDDKFATSRLFPQGFLSKGSTRLLFRSAIASAALNSTLEFAKDPHVVGKSGLCGCSRKIDFALTTPSAGL